MIGYLGLFVATFAGIHAQTCLEGGTSSGPCIAGLCPTNNFCQGSTICCPICAGSNGPCIGGVCPGGQTCAADGINCCPVTTTTTTTTAATTTASGTCVDLTASNGISSCPGLSYLCNNTIYYTLMTQQCPKTCNRCSGSVVTTTASSTCFDLTGPNGVSNCASVVKYCNAQFYPLYATLMQQQCPKTCGFCTSGR